MKGRTLLLLIGLAVILDRIALLNTFGFQYVGSDDLTFWQGATDYAKGVFHEPYFYGQNYNFMLEALMAVPLLWCGVPHHVALPVATSLLALFPFFFFALILYRNGRLMEAAFALLVPIALPVEHGMLTTVTRGFISGLFFCGFLIIPVLKPKAVGSFVVLALSCALGFLFNPNTAIIAVPVVVYVLLNNLKDLRLYMLLGMGAAGALFVQHLAREFYDDHPAYNVHSMWELRYTKDALVDGFSHLDRYFDHLMPVVWPVGWLVIVSVVLIGGMVWRSDRNAAISLFVGTTFALAVMGLNKVNDDAGILLHSSVRMYLALPLVCVVAFCWWVKGIDPPNWRPWALALAMVMLVVKIDVGGPVAQASIEPSEHAPVAIKHVKGMEWECAQMGDTLAKYDVDLLVLVPFWAKGAPEMEFLAYGCPLVDKRFERTMMNVYERRTWVFEAEQRKVHPHILLHGLPVQLDTLMCYPELKATRLDHNTVLIENQHYRTRFILGLFGVELRRNAYW